MIPERQVVGAIEERGGLAELNCEVSISTPVLVQALPYRREHRRPVGALEVQEDSGVEDEFPAVGEDVGGPVSRGSSPHQAGATRPPACGERHVGRLGRRSRWPSVPNPAARGIMGVAVAWTTVADPVADMAELTPPAGLGRQDAVAAWAPWLGRPPRRRAGSCRTGTVRPM